MDNQFDTFADWIKESWNGVENGTGKTPAELESLRRAWDHGQEAGYHEGHLDGGGLAAIEERERCAKLVETAGAYTEWNEDAVDVAAQIRAGEG